MEVVTIITRKKLIEVALPLDAINEGSKPETENPFLRGHPRSVHNWWARTPLSVCRAVLFAQIIDDPGNDLPPDQAREEREKLLHFVSRLATWEATTDEKLLAEARTMIRKACGGKIPQFWDMFAGRASIPLEAQRLGFEVTSSDLNPVAVIIEKALLEIPLRFSGQLPINPKARLEFGHSSSWSGSTGIVSDIRYYGQWMREEAEKRIGHLYPKVQLPREYGGKEAAVIAWLWARTVKCPSPACLGTMPLVSSFALSNKSGKKVWVEAVVDREARTTRFEVKMGDGTPPAPSKIGRGAKFRCLICREDASEEHIKVKGIANRMGTQLIAIVAEGERGRFYLPPSDEHETTATKAEPTWQPMEELQGKCRVSVPLYGMNTFADLFTSRQLVALTTFSDLICEVRERVRQDAIVAGLPDDGMPLHEGGSGADAYADAVATYLTCAISRLSDYSNSFCTWNSTNENVRSLFQRQAIPMVWDFAEANPIHGKLTIESAAEWVADALTTLPAGNIPARVCQLDARVAEIDFASPPIISTDPPYYNNISYADLSDFFYVWLRKSLREIHLIEFSTLLTPKKPELIASPYRHDGSIELAREHFRSGFENTFSRLKLIAHPEFPITVYYAFKQEEEDDKNGDERASTGWETMLEGLILSGFQITGTWPVRTTKKARSVARGTNALASAIVIVARQRPMDVPMATRREFISNLRGELPTALRAMMQANIAPVDFAQATIGSGMAVFSRYAKVLEADGSPMRVRTALQLINQELDTYFAEQEGELDADTRFCIAWFEQHGMNEGAFGEADVLARAKNTSVEGLARAGVFEARAGKVRLLRRNEYPNNWNPMDDRRLTVWECMQHLIRALERGGEETAARLANQLGGGGSEDSRALAYRLYAICERKGWAQEALAYNTIVSSWNDIQTKIASVKTTEEQGRLF